MIREAIETRINEKGLSQSAVCRALSLTVQNLNSFLRGRRPLPFDDVVSLLLFLDLSVGYIAKGRAEKDAEHIRPILRQAITKLDCNKKEFAQLCGILPSTISSFLKGSRNISLVNLESLINVLRMSILPYIKK